MRTLGAAVLIFAMGMAGAEARSRAPSKPKPSPPCAVPHRSDHDLLMRTVVGEARGEPFNGQVAVAAVVLNRVADGGFGGSTVRAVLARRKAFEPWERRCRMMLRLNARSSGWIDAMLAVNRALGGDDPTGGATHFANIPVVEKRRNERALVWIARMTNVRTIGRHTFGRSAEGRDLEPFQSQNPAHRSAFTETTNALH